MAGLGDNTVYTVHNNNLKNLRRGLLERVFFTETSGPDGPALSPPPQPEPGFYETVLSPVTTQLVRRLPKSLPCTTQEFVALYRGDRRQALYQQAVVSLQKDPLKASDARLGTFLKAEKVKITKEKRDPAPRVIQPRPPRYNVEVGRFLKPLEKRVFKTLRKVFGEVVVLKGLNAEGTAGALREKWERFVDPVAVGLDASRFDQHVSVPALEWEHSIYLQCFHGQDRKYLAKLLRMQIKNRGLARAKDGWIKYMVVGGRMSGDMNTSLGNCLIMCSLVKAFMDEQQVSFALANNGDDCIVICERRDLHKWLDNLAPWFLRAGFTMKVEKPVRVFEQIEFCQAHPVHCAGRWVMCRNALTALAKDSTTVLPVSSRASQDSWMEAIGQCGLALCAGMPIMQAAYLAMVSGCKAISHPYLETGMAMLAAGMAGDAKPVDDHSRVSFWEAYGWLPCEQVVFEAQLSQYKRTGITSRGDIYDPTYTVCSN